MTESKRLEYKREFTESIKNTVIAFANTDGGKLYIGINDDGSVIGVADVDGTMVRVTNMIRDAIRPDLTMFTDCDVEVIDEKNVVVITVQRGTARPYYLGSKGIRPEGVFVRQGTSSVPASNTMILQLIRETSGDKYEVARSLEQSLTFDITSRYFETQVLEFGESQKRTLKLIGEDNTYTNLGLLLSDQCPHTIKLAIFEGSQKTVFHSRKELSGSLLKQFEDACDYISRANHTRSEFEGMYRIDMQDYPPEALREALLNAIVHKDYGYSAPTLISIFDDRIEFVTVGGLVRGLSLDDIQMGVSMLRNEYLANILYRLNLIEAYGTGIMKIKECYRDCDVKPKLEVSTNAFKITLPNTNYHRRNRVNEQEALYRTKKNSEETFPVQMEDRETVILALLKDQGTLVRKDIEEVLNVSQATAVLLIRQMVEKGVLIKEGNGKYSRYRLNENNERNEVRV